MNSGLAKLQEASESVSKLKEELFLMEQELAQASAKAEKVNKEFPRIRTFANWH